MARCPICDKEAARRPANRAFPFCSDRCRLVDLGKWLGEAYRVPVGGGRGEDEDEDGLAVPGRRPDDELPH
jgi:endogenous inhibitor of DNA gyrase (YacG/DUF329 family)